MIRLLSWASTSIPTETRATSTSCSPRRTRPSRPSPPTTQRCSKISFLRRHAMCHRVPPPASAHAVTHHIFRLSSATAWLTSVSTWRTRPRGTWPARPLLATFLSVRQTCLGCLLFTFLAHTCRVRSHQGRGTAKSLRVRRNGQARSYRARLGHLHGQRLWLCRV